jgi:hypothetical protein
MSVNLSPVGNGFQFFTNNGEPLVGGKLDTYQAGSTTPLTTFTDSSGLIPNTNPIILGTDGRPPDTIWLSEGFFYKFVLSDANDVQIQVYDNLYGIIGVSPPAATPIPSGGILLWSGSIGSIPAGYVLCNGNNGTPDLRDRFVVGAGSTYAVDATGGSADAIVVSHTHTATSVVTDPGHAHLYGNTVVQIQSGNNATQLQANPVSVSTDTAVTGITVATTNANAGTSGTNANLPPYYAFATL